MKYKVGDMVILGSNETGQAWNPHMDVYVGKVATLRKPVGSIGWIPDGCEYYWDEKNMRLISCQCNVKNCLTHSKLRMMNGK